MVTISKTFQPLQNLSIDILTNSLTTMLKPFMHQPVTCICCKVK